MSREIAESVDEWAGATSPVLNFETGRIWVSGMNARADLLARQLADHLKSEGYSVSRPTDDGAVRHGGWLVPVLECEPIADETYRAVFGPADTPASAPDPEGDHADADPDQEVGDAPRQ